MPHNKPVCCALRAEPKHTLHKQEQGCRTSSVEVGSSGDTDLLLSQLHMEQHGLVGLGPGEVEARLDALCHGDAILEGALVEAVAGEL